MLVEVLGYAMMAPLPIMIIADICAAKKRQREQNMTTHRTIEMKPWRIQKDWLKPELLHRAPSAKLVQVNGKDGAQLEHPGGGPLTWVRCPHKDVVGVTRIDAKWYWLIDDRAAAKGTDGQGGAA